MTYVYLLLAIIIILLWEARTARRKAEERAASFERSRIKACLNVYNGWLSSNWSDFVKECSEKHGLDYMNLEVGIELRELGEEDVNISPWDTPQVFVLQGNQGLIRWQTHPDYHKNLKMLNENVERERTRLGTKQ